MRYSFLLCPKTFNNMSELKQYTNLRMLTTADKGVLLSGCQTNEATVDVSPPPNSHSLQKVLQQCHNTQDSKLTGVSDEGKTTALCEGKGLGSSNIHASTAVMPRHHSSYNVVFAVVHLTLLDENK
jgi:hypothetical protein